MSPLNKSPRTPHRLLARLHTPRAKCARRLAVFLAALCVFAASASLFFYVCGRAATPYYSKGSLPPELVTSWSTTRDGLGASPPNFTSGDTFVIQNGHNMTTVGAWSISGTGSKLQIEGGGTLTATGAVTLATATTFQIDGGGTYAHNNNSPYASTIFRGTESFAPTSTVILNNSNTTGPSNVAFGNLTINFTSAPGGPVNCAGGLTSLAGNLTLLSTSAQEFRLTSNSPYTLNIGGDLVIQGGTLNLTNGSGAGNAFAVNLGGKLDQSGGTFTSTNTGSIPTVAFTGGSSSVNFKQSAGTFNDTNINWRIALGKTVEFDNAFAVAASRTFNVNSGSTLLAAATVTNNGTTTVDGEFRLTDGGFATGNNFSYGVSGTLSFSTTNGYIVGPTDASWPTSNGPVNVNAIFGGITLNATRTVGGLFQTSSGVAIGGGNTLALNGTCQINAGGFFSNPPTYGSSSLLKYNIGNPSPAFGRNGEWLPDATSGPGYPSNVRLANNTTLDLANSFTASTFQMSGDLTVDPGSTMLLAGNSPMTKPLVVLGNVTDNGTITLSTASGGDIKVGGNWTRGSGASLNANGRAVFFNGAGTQTVTLTGGGTQAFDYLVVDKSGGSLLLGNAAGNLTSASVNANSGNVLQIVNAGGIDLNGQTLTLNNAGGSILVGGGARSITGTVGSTFVFAGAKSVASTSSGTLSFGSNVNVNVSAGVDFGAGLSTVGGKLSIKSGGFVNTDPPAYAPGSTLEYDNGASYDAAAEFPASGVQNVSLASTTQLNLNSDKSIAGTFAAGARNVGTNAAMPRSLSANSITVSTGTLNLNNVTTGSSFNSTGAAQVNVAGNWNVAGFGAGTSTVNFDGAGAQVVQTASVFNNLTTSNDLSLGASPAVGGTLALGSHKITTNANTLAVGGAGVVTRTSGFIIGNEQKTFNANGNFIFDVGTANGYAPVEANSTTPNGTGSLTVSGTDGKLTGVAGANALQRFWTLAGSNVTTNLTFHYNAPGDIAGTESNYKIIKHDASGFTVPTNQSSDANAHTATVNGVNSFSDWTLAEVSSVFGQIQFAQANTDTLEGDSGSHNVDIAVRRTGGTGGAVSVDYSVTDGTATTADNDYSASPAAGTLNWADGDATDKNITVTVNGDTKYEADETINLAVSNASGGAALGSPASATLTIKNDDPAPTINVTGGPLSFGNVPVDGASAEQTYMVSGSSLTADINVNAPADFQVSKTTGASFGSSVTLTQSGGSVASTTIFVRFAPTGAGAQSGNVTNASAGAATQNVAVNGTGVSPDYTVTTTNNAIVLTDVSGNGDTLAITEPSAGNIEFAAPGRVFVINGSAAVTGDSGSLSLSGVNSITVNQGDGDDTTNVGAFTSALPSLTINGDAGDDTVNLNGDITFAADANLDVDLQNDTATPGTDALNVAANANLLTSGAGTITVRCSQSVTLNAGSSFETVNGGITVEANQQATSTTGNFVGVTISGGIVQSSGIGNVVVNGRGGAGTAPNLYGVFVADAGQVKATAGGSVTLNGTGGGTGASNADYGVAFQSSGVVQVQNGPLNITGTSGPVGGFGYGVLLDFGSSGSALSNGSGAITVNATGNGTSVDFYGAVNSGFTHTIGGASATGPIMIIANNENLDGGSGTVNVQTTGAVTFKQRTSNVAINLGGGDVIGGSPTLGLSNAEINKVNAPTINFGDGNSGAIIVSAGITRPAPTELNLTSGGAINLNADALDSDGGNVTLTPGSGSSVTPASAGTDVSTGTAGTLAFSSGANLAVAINGTTADTQYQQLNVVGKVNLTGLNLTLGGSFVPAAGQSFVVVNNDGAEAINGTFDGLPQGATISNFLNSGFDATISYTGGDGNDSVITVNPQPAFSIDDVTHLEGDGGTTDFTFIVTRSGATALGASVDYATQDGTATAADNDYQSAGGTLNFAAGETTKEITVHVNGDTTPELDETFKVLLGNASGATVAGGTGTGTIRNDDESASAGQLIISEFRLRGPGGTETTGAPAQSSAYSKPRTSVSFAPPSDGADTTPQANDEFVELYNNTDSPLLVTTTDGSKGWALAASDGVVRFVVPAGTLIPARGHFLGVNTLGYSLSGYPAGNDGAAATTATGDPLLLGDGTHANGYTLDIPDNMGIAVFRTANPSSFGKAGVRLDAAGSTSESNPLYKEGAGYPALAPSDIAQNLQHSFYRSLCSFQGACTTPGVPKDTNDNAADFLFVDTKGTLTAAGQRLGAPGPENLSGHVQRNSQIALAPLDRSVSAASPPNRSRDLTQDPGHNSPFGTLSIRRRVTNNTGAPVAQLRFRIVEITTSPAASGVADLRALSSGQVSVSDVGDSDTCVGPVPCTVTVQGTTLEEPPTQLSSTGGTNNGGGYNSSLSVGTITLSAPLAPGDSVNVQFLLGVKQTGSFRILVNVEAATAASKKK